MAIPATNRIVATFPKKYISVFADHDKGTDRFGAALRTIEEGIQAGKIWNQEFLGAKSWIASGCEHAQHVDSGPARGAYHHGGFGDCRDNIGYAFGMNQAAKMSRELKKLAKRFPAVLKPEIADYILTLDQIDAVWKWLQSVKPIIVKGRKPSVTKTAAQTAEELSNTGSCAICANRQKLTDETKMVEHGYKMSEYNHAGYRMGKCFGVGYRPYEISNEANVAFKPVLANHKRDLTAVLKTLKSGEITSVDVQLEKWEGSRKVPYIRTYTKVADKIEFDREIEFRIARVESELRMVNSDIKTNDTKIEGWTLQPLLYGDGSK